MRMITTATIAVPLGLVQSGGGLRWTELPVRCGVIEAGGRRLLVDAGLGARVTRGERSRPLRAYAALMRPKRRRWHPGPVDAVLLTHLHADHIGGLRDLPPGTRLLASRGAIATVGDLTPARAALRGLFPELLPEGFADRVEEVEALPEADTGTVLGKGYALPGVEGRLDGHLAVPLPGHAPGHLGVFWRDRGRPRLYAADAAWTLAALRADATPAPARRLVFADPGAAAATEATLRRFMAEGGTVTLCHDPAPLP